MLYARQRQDANQPERGSQSTAVEASKSTSEKPQKNKQGDQIPQGIETIQIAKRKHKLEQSIKRSSL